MSTVLLVDDQRAIRAALRTLFEIHGLECLEAADPESALEIVRREDIGVVVQDMNFTEDTTSGQEGMALFRRLRELDPGLPIVLMTAWTSLEAAVQLVKEGAADYLSKPWDDRKLLVTVQNLMRLRALEQESRRVEAQRTRARRMVHAEHDLSGLVYKSEAMQQVVSLAVSVARADVPVLITGPNGSGKEKLAEIVCANSTRRGRPFVRVNAGALPDQLLEAELFGAEAGAFTGATKLRVGRFEAADGGTLFLDEIGNLSAAGQAKLLRVLQQKEFERLGSSVTRKADVRVISATNLDLRDAIKKGTFREDLYYRLNVIELRVPPLRERPEDLDVLADCFLERFAPGGGKRLGAAARAALRGHDWPGNVRELENCVQRAVLVAPGVEIQPSDLGLAERASAGGIAAADLEPPTLGDAERAERAAIEDAIVRSGGVISRVATELGLSRQALYRRMERLGIVLERRPRGS